MNNIRFSTLGIIANRIIAVSFLIISFRLIVPSLEVYAEETAYSEESEYQDSDSLISDDLPKEDKQPELREVSIFVASSEAIPSVASEETSTSEISEEIMASVVSEADAASAVSEDTTAPTVSEEEATFAVSEETVIPSISEDIVASAVSEETAVPAVPEKPAAFAVSEDEEGVSSTEINTAPSTDLIAMLENVSEEIIVTDECTVISEETSEEFVPVSECHRENTTNDCVSDEVDAISIICTNNDHTCDDNLIVCENNDESAVNTVFAADTNNNDDNAAEIDEMVTDFHSISDTEAEDTAIHYSFEIKPKALNAGKTDGYTGWKTVDNKSFWYENGVKQGTEGRGKEIYDPGTDAWYWLDAVQGGAKAVNKEVYMPYTVLGKDTDGKWVRFDSDGHMIKGWYVTDGNTYFYDYGTGSMAKGRVSVNGLPCWFDSKTGVGKNRVWEKQNGQNTFWYENGRRQGVDPSNTEYRGREIYDPASNAWYWLDNCYEGKKATSKEVYIPYTVQGQDSVGKWVRYDRNGRMIKGWYTVDGADIFDTPQLAGNRYYYNNSTGAMHKGFLTSEGKLYYFDDVSGILNAHALEVNISSLVPDSVINVKSLGAIANDSKDDTAAFRKSIDSVSSSRKTVYVPAGKYIIDATVGIYLKSNMNLIMDRNAVLEVKGNSSESYNVIGLRKIHNVNIFGGKIIGERNKHSGNSGESGVGIGIYDSSKVTIAYTDIASNWGDGVYLGSEGYWYDKHGAKEVTLRGCSVHDNRRSNISIVDAENITIDSCTISNAKGTAPQCGINVEPHSENGKIPADRKCEHLTIKHTTVNTVGEGDPNGQFFTFMTIHNPYDKTYISSDDIFIDDCVFNGDCGNYSGTNCRMSYTVIKGILYDRQNTKLTSVKYRMLWKHEVS